LSALTIAPPPEPLEIERWIPPPDYIGELQAIREILERLTVVVPTRQLAYGGLPVDSKLQNYPVPGIDRVIAKNKTRGNSGLVLTANSFVDVLPNNSGRSGLSLINIGTNPAFVYLSKAGDALESPGIATGYLFATGVWDGRISDELWCGPVSAMSLLGTTLVLAEL
jgi:hypothetical protein